MTALLKHERPALPRRPRGRPRQYDLGTRPRVADLLLEAGIALFARHGFASVSIRQIAARAGVDPAMISHIFGSKQRLWESAVDLAAELMVNALNVRLDKPPGATPADRLAQALVCLIDVLCDTPELAAFILRETVLENGQSDYGNGRLVQKVGMLLLPLFSEHTEETRPGADTLSRYIMVMGAIVTSAAARPWFVRLGDGPAPDDHAFRANLKVTILDLLGLACPQTRGVRPEGLPLK